MRVLSQLLFVLGALPTIGGIIILVLLAPKPRRMQEHLQGLARYLMLGGVGFSTARVLSGWQPTWDAVLLMLGLGLAMAMYARENHLLALAQERLGDRQESSA